MINYESVELNGLCIHRVGNKVREEELNIAEGLVDIEDGVLYNHLLKYFFHNFKRPEYYHLNHDNDSIGPNPILESVRSIFELPQKIYEQSIKIAEFLYDIQSNANIKSGDLMVAYFNNVVVEDEVVDAIGIFKAEQKDTFLKIIEQAKNFTLNYDEGFHVEKLDKGCLILNTEQQQGYKVCVLDKGNENQIATFWKNDFLRLKIRNDKYHFTSNYLQMTKSFLKEYEDPETELGKLQESEILGRSQQFFQENEQLNQEEYAEEIFQDPELIQSFQNYKNKYLHDNQMDVEDNFEISAPAVKNQSGIFKSVIKLDRNFHIYIHGDRTKIERGKDEYGRKFYKVYYEEEN